MVLALIQLQKILELNRMSVVRLCSFCHLISEKDFKNISWGKENIFNKWSWKNWTSTCRRQQSDLYLSPWININSKRIKYLPVKHKTLKLVEENTHSILQNIVDKGKDFHDRTSFIQEIRPTIDRWNIITKNFYTSQEEDHRMGGNNCYLYFW